MPFCSSCGAEVKGAFCSSCGAAAAAQNVAAHSAPSPVVPGGIPMPPPAAPRKTSVWVWVLFGIFGFIFLGICAAMMVGYWFVRNPGAALGKILTAANPDAEVLNVDNAGRRITIRDKRNGKEVTLSFDDVKDGHFTLSATDENGKTGRVELGGGAGRLPSWVPVYPGAKIEGHASGTGVDGDNIAE